MKLLQKKLEDDRRSLEKQFRTDMETQRVVMKDMMTANMEKMRIGTQAIIDQNQTLQDTLLDTVRNMNEDRERRDGQILELQSQIAKQAKRGPCVIL